MDIVIEFQNITIAHNLSPTEFIQMLTEKHQNIACLAFEAFLYKNGAFVIDALDVLHKKIDIVGD